MENEAESCITVGSLETFPGQAVDEMVANRMEYVGARRYRQGTKRRVWRGFIAEECSVRTRR